MIGTGRYPQWRILDPWLLAEWLVNTFIFLVSFSQVWIMRPGRALLKKRWSLLLYVMAFVLVNVAFVKKNLLLGIHKDQPDNFFIITNASDVNPKDVHP